MGTVWVSYGWTRRKPLENQGVSGKERALVNKNWTRNQIFFNGKESQSGLR